MMKVKTLPLEKLKPAPYNPRIEMKPGSDEWRRLERSLSEFGLVQPLVWNEQTGHVVGGHQRLAILKHQGMTEIEVVVVSLDESREKALNISLNNRNLASDWDANLLFDLLHELQEDEQFDASLTGFDPEELNEMLLSPVPGFQPAEEEELSENVRITLEIASDKWEEFRPVLDSLLEDWEVSLHVRL